MPNMSYCRFENTRRDMEDCLHAIEYGEAEDLSKYEHEALKDFLDLAKEIVNLENKINDILERYEQKRT